MGIHRVTLRVVWVNPVKKLIKWQKIRVKTTRNVDPVYVMTWPKENGPEALSLPQGLATAAVGARIASL